jgi:predicted HicB family RNase H-like nuclease
MKKARRVLGEARQKADLVESWADFSNALFNPVDGIITKAYPTQAEREAFFQTEQYQSIRHLLHEAIEKFGLVEGATPKKSGRFVVRLPQSLHLALEQEAEREGVSLNHLVVTKLAVQLNRLVGVRPKSGFDL